MSEPSSPQSFLVARLAPVVDDNDLRRAEPQRAAQTADGVERDGGIAVGGHDDRHVDDPRGDTKLVPVAPLPTPTA